MGRLVANAFPGASRADDVEGRRAAEAPPISSLLAAYQKSDTGRYEFLLLFRFAVANLVGFALLGAAYLQGWVDRVIVADSTHLSVAIFIVFLGGLAIAARKVYSISREINYAKAIRRPRWSKAAMYLAEVEGRDAGSRGLAASALRLKLVSRIAIVRQVASSLVLMGLVGTVIGFIIALSGVKPESAADVSTIGPMVATLISGMSVALYTTLVGSVLNIWLMVDYHILATGTVKLITSIVEEGERYARHRSV